MNKKRICEFTFTREGITQSINENDFFTREEFLKERQDFIKQGIKIKDTYTSEPFIPYKQR